jgi:hypothetical protein
MLGQPLVVLTLDLGALAGWQAAERVAAGVVDQEAEMASLSIVSRQRVVDDTIAIICLGFRQIKRRDCN